MPKLKATVKSLDSVPEELRSLYSQEGDEYVLDVDGSDYKSKINEFRQNNIDLAKKLDAATSASDELKKLQETFAEFEGIDPKKAKDALKKMQSIKEQKLIAENKFEEVFQQRTERMRADHEAQVQALTANLEKESTSSKNLRSKLSKHLIDDTLQKAITSVARPKSTSMRDILSRGRDIWQLDEEKDVPIPRDRDGKIIYGKEANSPMDVKEWAQNLVSEAPHLFESSSGGGSGGSRQRVEGEREVSRDDARALSDNIEDIAKGKVRVI